MKTNITVSASFTTVEDACTATVASVQRSTIQLAGTWAGTVSFEATVDGSTWHAVGAHVSTVAFGGAVVTSATANGLWRLDVTEFQAVRARYSTDTSGTVLATISTARHQKQPV